VRVWCGPSREQLPSDALLNERGHVSRQRAVLVLGTGLVEAAQIREVPLARVVSTLQARVQVSRGRRRNNSR
jgi:hypothetical protein